VPIVTIATPVKPARILKRERRGTFSRPDTSLPRDAYRILRPAWRGPQRAELRLIGLAGGWIALELLRPWPAMLLFDRVLLQAPARRGVFGLSAELSIAVLALAFAAVAVLTGALATWTVAAARDVGRTVATDVRRQVSEHLHRLQLPTQVSSRSGELLVRIMRDVSVVRDAVFETGLASVKRGVLVSAMAIVLVWLDPLLAVCALLPMLGLAAVKDHRPAVGTPAAVVRPAHLMAGAGLMLVLYVGARRALAGALTPGELLVALAYTRAMATPLHHRPSQPDGSLDEVAPAAARVLELLGRQPEPSGIGLPPRRLEGDIACRGVRATSSNGADALAGATFSVRPGTVAVFVGAGGSGTSTLLALLLRLRRPDAGQLFVDGRSIESYEMHSYRKCLAFVPEDPQLFAGTIRDNILYGRPDASEADVEKAARAALLADTVERTAEAYGTTLEEEGAHRLTNAEVRHLVLARAALRHPSILILQEPFAGLDAASRRSVAAAIRSVAAGRTTLVIGGDPCDELAADAVFHLADGTIVHEELRQASPDHPQATSPFAF
jgi:ATP-binding cassette, subfamily B, bacterial